MGVSLMHQNHLDGVLNQCQGGTYITDSEIYVVFTLYP